ncbi:oxidative damage protection protein [Pyrinomonas methylaliphatogenes]|jgi:Fe-S cluster biosynthesis and repair protein YggX|uniref:Fe-S cluster protector protein n=1 Tax=Pyrinomonas methylaliphatogenes TaxID=454194 RepID=A0A0B6X0W2_9BACT|nr:oxidative damage protection protein [Pyrinomonas methylaliphatogenes]MBX5478271.1 oxidative damage protection protein [Pyrinomonas methylaliphatogenes]CDM66607.1 Fe-S cluster protector protein [Pyrinomonas methylaliphatogenes]
MSETIKCARCGQKRSALGYAPVPVEIGQRIAQEICQPCWSQWLQQQTMLINHFGLNVADPEAQEFLLDQMRAFFFGQGSQADIDTSKQGTIQW